MVRQERSDLPPPDPGGREVRVVRSTDAAVRWRRRLRVWLPLLAVAAGFGVLLHRAGEQGPAEVSAVSSEQMPAPQARVHPLVLLRAVPNAARSYDVEPPDDYALPSQDFDDLANYIAPGDPVPTMGEVIDALHEAGIHSGLGAFNPPGTSPPLVGLAVPDDFELPEGFVRHHQVTDEGEPIEPILMFSPDYEFYDEAGRRVELPADLVVPPDMAPPGMPIRPIEIPSAQEPAR